MPGCIDSVRGGERAPRETLEAPVQGGSAAQRFLRGWIRLADGSIGETKQPISCRDDVLDFRACLCLEHRNGVNQHRLVRDEVPQRLEFRERCACGYASTKDSLSLGTTSRRKIRHFVERPSWIEGHVDLSRFRPRIP